MKYYKVFKLIKNYNIYLFVKIYYLKIVCYNWVNLYKKINY